MKRKTFDDKLKLITYKNDGKDDYGKPKYKEEENEVYCKVLPIGQKEYLIASQQGLRFGKKFALHSFEYNGEQKIKYNEQMYTVHRIYDDGFEVELSCEETYG